MLCEHASRARSYSTTRYAAIACIAITTVALWQSAARDVDPQVSTSRVAIKRVYVGALGGRPGADVLREKLVRRLLRTHEIEIVASPGDADAIVIGKGEIWFKEYVRTSPKPGTRNVIAVYDGYLSVELEGRNSEKLWSCRVKHQRFACDGITDELAKRVAKQFQAYLKIQK